MIFLGSLGYLQDIAKTEVIPGFKRNFKLFNVI